MKETIAYEMVYDKTLEYQNDIMCVPFLEKYLGNSFPPDAEDSWENLGGILANTFYRIR